MRKCAVGGQAVMEGVMMKSDKGIAMAVRRADGKIVASYKNQVSKAQKGTFWGLPVIRGVVALVESLTTGMSTTMDSAKMYGKMRLRMRNRQNSKNGLRKLSENPLKKSQ